MSTDPSTTTPGARGSKLTSLLNSPITGLSPWIVMSLVAGEGRLELAAILALAMSVTFVLLSLVRGSSLKLLELCDTVFFTAVTVAALVASEGTADWLENWSGELSNIALVVIAVGSLAIRLPFTLQYAREETDPALWDNPAFIHTNYLLTGVWALAFVVMAASGAFGDLVLDNSNNLWTGWIIQTAAIVVAIQFTVWYPKVAHARGRIAQGLPSDPPPPVSELLVALSIWLVPVGVISLIVGAAPVWVGVAFIAAGALTTHALSRHIRSARTAAAAA